jgi:uncharacterized protein YdaU (DUF1376 family)
MPDFYKMDPAAWDMGTTCLTLEQEAAYLRIINCMHKHKSPVPDNDRVLAGLFRTSTRKARSLVNALIEAGKIQAEGGVLSNERAASDLVHRGFVSVSRAESGAKGGRTRAANAAKTLKSQDACQANASYREEKRREENAEPYGSDGQAVENEDFAKQVWDRGIAFLGRFGVDEKPARSFIGKLRKDHSDADIFDAFSRCSKSGAVDPIPWITKALQKPPERQVAPRADTSRINPDGSYRYDT